MDPVIFAAADVQVPTGIPTGLPSGVTEAAAKILAADSVYGPFLVVAGAVIVALAVYIKFLHAARGTERDQSAAKIDAIQEKRIEELKTSTRAQADVEAVLSKFTETVQGVSRTLEGLSSNLRESGLKQDATGRAVDDALKRIEADVAELSKKIDRPLVQTKQGLTRTPGVVS